MSTRGNCTESELVWSSSTVFDDYYYFLYSIISDISVLKLKVDKCSRQDNLFMKKVFLKIVFQLHCVFSDAPLSSYSSCSCCCVLSQHGQQLYRHIYLGCKEESSGRQHYEALFALLGLLSMELANEEVVVDLIRLALALQVLTTLISLTHNHMIQL